MMSRKGMNRIYKKDLKEKLTNIIETHEQYKNSYFWTPLKGSEDWEKKYYFFWEKSKVEIFQSCEYSSHNVYYQLAIYVDGVKKDIRILKKVLKK